MTLAVDKLNGCGISNTTHHESLAINDKIDTLLATEESILTT